MLISVTTGIACNGQKNSIAGIKRLRQNSLYQPKNLENTLDVSGYFFQDPIPLLITDTTWAYVNLGMPDSAYIVLNGPPSLTGELQLLQGQRIEVRGRINPITEKPTGSKRFFDRIVSYDVDFNIVNYRRIGSQVPDQSPAPGVIDHCKENPQLCQQANIKHSNMALLYAGGKSLPDAHGRYWNDLTFMYHTLRSKYGYTDEQIVVVYKEGLPENYEMRVDFPATATGVKDAFDLLRNRLSERSDLFVFMSNHGGGYWKKKSKNFDGLSDEEIYDETDEFKVDEVTYYYEQRPNVLPDDSLAAMINSLQFRQLMGVFEQCFSGGFLYDLRGNNRVLISASSEVEPSYGFKRLDYDVFSYYFTCAMNSATPDGDVVDANEDGDLRISLLEAFNYAQRKDRRRETPHLEDTGDGIGVAKPNALPGQDGLLASKCTLGVR